MSVFFTRRGAAAQTGKLLGDYAEGDIVYLNESGSPVEFYVAKHDYESELNGSGRTLLVRKDIYDMRVFNSTANDAFSGSDIDTWLNGTYKDLLDAKVQTAIGTTTFYYTPGYGNYTVTTLSRAVFLLSLAELGKTADNTNVEGSALPCASTLQIAYLNGTANSQWTRSPNDLFNYSFLNILTKSGSNSTEIAVYENGSRPIFTLPSTTLFNKDDTFKGA